jgi:hypothetical protein
MKDQIINLGDSFEASVEMSADGFAYVSVEVEFVGVTETPLYVEAQLVVFRGENIVSISDPSASEVSTNSPCLYLSDSYYAGTDQIADGYLINYRTFFPAESFVIETPVPPEIARQSGAYLIHSPKSGLFSRERWESGEITAESIVVKNVAGEDDELFANVSTRKPGFAGFRLTCASAESSDYTFFRIMDKPQVSSDPLRVHLQKELQVNLTGFTANEWLKSEKQTITDIKHNFQGESSSNELNELSEAGVRITVDEIMRWRSDLNLGMSVDPSTAAELVDFDDPDEYYQVIRYLCGYVIDKYQVAHEDHERDWAGNAILLDIFKPHRIGAVQEWDGIENPSDEEADEYFSVESLSNYSGLSQEERIVLAYNYLLSMRGASLYESKNAPELSEAEWRSELEQTLQFLRYSDQDNGDDDVDESFFDEESP